MRLALRMRVLGEILAWEEYDPKTIRTIMDTRGLNATDVSRRTCGKVGRSTVRNLILGERETAQEKTLAAIAKALYVSVDKLRKRSRDGNGTAAFPHGYDPVPAF